MEFAFSGVVHMIGRAPYSYCRSPLRSQRICAMQVQLKQKESASTVAPYSKSYDRSLISTIIDSEDGGLHAVRNSRD